MNKIFYLLIFNVLGVVGFLFYLNVQVYFRIKSNESRMQFSQQVVQEVQQSKTVIEETLIKHKGEIATKEKLIDKEKEKNIDLSRKLSEKVNETLILKNVLNQKKTIEKKFSEEREKFEKEKKELLSQVETLEADKKNLEERIGQLKKAPLLREAAVVQHSMSMNGPGLAQKSLKMDHPRRYEGTVLSQHLDYNLVMVDLGATDHIFLGQYLSVFRNEGMIGKIRVEKVSEKVSSAFILRDTFTNKKIAQGDIVKIFH